MLLFFAVRRHHASYFKKLSGVMRTPSRVVRHKECLLPVMRRLPAASEARLREITALKVDEIAQARPNYSLGELSRKFFSALFFLIGYYRLLCYLRLFRQTKPTWVALWSGVMWNQSLAVEAGKLCQVRFIFFENGLLPNTTTIDPVGVNYLNAVPRNAAFYRSLDAAIVPGKVDLVPRAPKTGKVQSKPIVLPKRYLFIPFQVDVDRQILMYSPWIRQMRHFYRVMTSMLDVLPEDMWLVFKEHPSSAKDYSDLRMRGDARVVFANDNNTQELIENAQVVITINSTVGIEALMLGEPVITLGQAFYNIDGIVRHAETEQQLRAILSQLDMLSVDAELTRHFIWYLANIYTVSGSWKVADHDHLAAAVTRIENIMRGEFPPVRLKE